MPVTPEATLQGLAPFEPHCEQDIDDKMEFDALASAVHEIEGSKQ